MPAFILIATGILSLLGLVCGYYIRRYIPPGRWIFVLVVLISVLPWFLHHLALLNFAEGANTETYDNYANFSLALNLRSFEVIALAACVVFFLPRRLWLIATGVPILGFVVAWNLTLPQAYEFTRTPFDNVRTIWLFIWTVSATGLLLAFCWPQRQRY